MSALVDRRSESSDRPRRRKPRLTKHLAQSGHVYTKSLTATFLLLVLILGISIAHQTTASSQSDSLTSNQNRSPSSSSQSGHKVKPLEETSKSKSKKQKSGGDEQDADAQFAYSAGDDERRIARSQMLLASLKKRTISYQLVELASSEAAFLSSSSSGSDTPSWKRQPGRRRRRSVVQASDGGSPVADESSNNIKQNQVLGYYNKTDVVIRVFNYVFRLDLELNTNLFAPSLIQNHFLFKGAQQISTQKIDHCYYHARSKSGDRPEAIGAFRICNGLSGIIHVGNQSYVVHPFYEAKRSHADENRHIIYSYHPGVGETAATTANDDLKPLEPKKRECANARLHEWALRQYNKQDECQNCDQNSNLNLPTKTMPHEIGRKRKRDVSLTEKYIELALVLSQDIFDKRNSSARLDVLHDAIQIVNCLDLYFRSANTRVALVYVETWAYGDQIDMSTDVKQTLYNFVEYSNRKLYRVSMDAVHLLTGGYGRQFDNNEVGMSIPDSICTSRAVSVSQEASIFEPFIAASTMAHMLGHNLGMEHDRVEWPSTDVSESAIHAPSSSSPTPTPTQPLAPSASLASVNSNELNKMLLVRFRSMHGNKPQGEHSAPGDLSSDEHEDEIKSRSLLDESDQNAFCVSNCLMSERLTYLQPPVSFGNMIQQQIAHHSTANSTNGSPSSSFVTVFSEGGGSGRSDQIAGSGAAASASSETHLAASALPYKFSRQSIEFYHKLLRTGRAICLFNKPNQLEDFKNCGNGIVDKGEDCDCGTFKECSETDSCCDPVTCRFRADAECINGACCDRCKLRARGFVCRKARGECDLAETCDGKSGTCAPDVHKHNGHPCAAGQGFCYLGQCPLHDAQCAELWSSDARQADRLCYASFNGNGTVRGNCGPTTPTLAQNHLLAGELHPTSQSVAAALRKYKRCDSDNIMCGTLQCQLGDMRPVTASGPSDSNSQAEFSKKVLLGHDGQRHECKAVLPATTTTLQTTQQTAPASYHPSQSLPPSSSSTANQSSSMATQTQASSAIGYVRDGSKCAHNKVCFNQTCRSIEQVYRDSFELCPRDERGRLCSDNGICSTANRCHCEPNWAGFDCSQPSKSAGQPPSGLNRSTQQQQPSGEQRHLIMQPEQLMQRVTHTTLVENRQNLSTVETPAVTEPSSTTTSTTTPPPAPPAVSAPSNVVLDKKKYDALSAQTLVLILVSIVAAVYVGFALMANCYRRKGFIKPDKVLRHHQLNCKLDALRSSFIARRLAEADVFETNGPPANPYLTSAQMSGGGDQFEQLQTFTTYENEPPPQMMKSRQQQPQSRQYFGVADQTNQPQPECALHQIQPHLFQDTSDHIPLLLDCGTNQSSNQMQHATPLEQLNVRTFNVDPNPNNNNKIPRIAPWAGKTTTLGAPYISRQRQTRRAEQRTFGVVEPPNKMTATTTPSNSSKPGAPIQPGSAMNRATSLGNVSRQTNANSAAANKSVPLKSMDGGTQLAMIAQGVLATPSRAALAAVQAAQAAAVASRRLPGLSLNQQQQPATRRSTNFDLDSCSAPSSPDHREPCWTSDAERHQRAPPVVGQQRMAVRDGPQMRHASVSYHEDIILGAMGAAKSVDQMLHQPPLPVPLPLPPSPLPDDTDEEGHLQQQHMKKRQISPQSSRSLTKQHIRQIPLNDRKQHLFEEDRFQDDSVGYDEDDYENTAEQLSLIAQLQQLERVQSLHQKQQLDNAADGLHEFFSLPLSIQLSALLARSLAPTPTPPATTAATTPKSPIDDYLNTLNSTNVAMSSRRSFKRPQKSSRDPSQQVQPTRNSSTANAANNGNTLKRQQIKLHNLRELINRLEKLHNQTVLQQQQLEQALHDTGGATQLDVADDGDDDDNLEQVPQTSGFFPSTSRQSTPSRLRAGGKITSHHSHQQQRSMQTAQSGAQNMGQQDYGQTTLPRKGHPHSHHHSHHHSQPQQYELQQQQQPKRSLQRSSTGRSRESIGAFHHQRAISRNESVYSMSDSEDGAYVSRMLVSYQERIAKSQAKTAKIDSPREMLVSHSQLSSQSSQTEPEQQLSEPQPEQQPESSKPTNREDQPKTAPPPQQDSSPSSEDANSCIDQQQQTNK